MTPKNKNQTKSQKQFEDELMTCKEWMILFAGLSLGITLGLLWAWILK